MPNHEVIAARVLPVLRALGRPVTADALGRLFSIPGRELATILFRLPQVQVHAGDHLTYSYRSQT